MSLRASSITMHLRCVPGGVAWNEVAERRGSPRRAVLKLLRARATRQAPCQLMQRHLPGFVMPAGRFRSFRLASLPASLPLHLAQQSHAPRVACSRVLSLQGRAARHASSTDDGGSHGGDYHMQRRTGRVLARIADRVPSHGCLVRFRPLHAPEVNTGASAFDPSSSTAAYTALVMPCEPALKPLLLLANGVCSAVHAHRHPTGTPGTCGTCGGASRLPCAQGKQ